jgi:hypothetical protein
VLPTHPRYWERDLEGSLLQELDDLFLRRKSDKSLEEWQVEYRRGRGPFQWDVSIGPGPTLLPGMLLSTASLRWASYNKRISCGCEPGDGVGVALLRPIVRTKGVLSPRCSGARSTTGSPSCWCCLGSLVARIHNPNPLVLFQGSRHFGNRFMHVVKFLMVIHSCPIPSRRDPGTVHGPFPNL